MRDERGYDKRDGTHLKKKFLKGGGVIVEDKKLPSMRITVCAVHIVEQLVS